MKILDPYDDESFFYLLREGEKQVYIKQYKHIFAIGCVIDPTQVISYKNFDHFGIIWDTGEGKLTDSTKLAWNIDEEYSGQGLMTLALHKYLQVLEHARDGFEAQILKTNLKSIKLAERVGFTLYNQDDEWNYYVFKK